MIKEEKLVSIIMSAYNSENTIIDSIESLLNQTYKNIEILIVDDCSVDKTYEICEHYEKKNENIILFKNEENIGLTKSLNLLINEANGTYIARQDCDDFSLDSRIEKQLEYIETYKLDACSSRAYINPTGKLIPNLTYFLPKKFVIRFKNPFIHGTLLIKKSVLNKIGNYNEKFYFAQDYKLMSELIRGKFKVRIIKEPLYVLNMDNNISSNFSKEQKYYADCVRKNLEPVKHI